MLWNPFHALLQPHTFVRGQAECAIYYNILCEYMLYSQSFGSVNKELRLYATYGHNSKFYFDSQLIMLLISLQRFFFSAVAPLIRFVVVVHTNRWSALNYRNDCVRARGAHNDRCENRVPHKSKHLPTTTIVCVYFVYTRDFRMSNVSIFSCTKIVPLLCWQWPYCVLHKHSNKPRLPFDFERRPESTDKPVAVIYW